MNLVKQIEELIKLLDETKNQLHLWVVNFKNEAEEHDVKKAEKIIGEVNTMLDYMGF